jgi:peptidoglycan/xylan/chitin deacetylase (PgdA/CDA1 family)
VPAQNELIITFHGLGEPPPGASEGERRVWVPAEWLEALTAPGAREGVSFAFDDGNTSDIELALPILQAHGLTARFFILTGRLGQDGYLSATDVRRLHEASMQIGSHGVNHRDWRAIGPQELRAETADSRTALAELTGAPVSEAACPFGSYDRRVLRALRDAGYERIFTSDGGPGTAGARLMPRTSITTDQPLQHWLDLAADGPRAQRSPVTALKRLAKRLR